MAELTFEITKNIGVLSTSARGWTKELNLVSWNEREPKYDIREWNPDKADPFDGMPATRLELQRYYFDLLGHLLPRRNDPEVRSFLELQLSQGYLFLKHPGTDAELEKMRDNFIARLKHK